MSIQIDPLTLALNGLDNVIRTWENQRTNLKGDNVATLSSVITNDIGDARNFREYIFSVDANFRRLIEMVMELDSAPRDEILEEFDRQGLRASIEETGLVKFADKEPSILEAQPVLQAIERVKREHEDVVVFYNGKMIAVLAGEVRGMYEVHVAANPVELTTA